MENLIRVIIAGLTLGISEIIKAAKEKKDESEYRYTPKSKKNTECRYRKRCKDWDCCLETLESCKKVKNGICPAAE